MRATESATAAYHTLHPDLHSTILGRTGLHVSGVGFGSYRVSAGVEGHRIALRKALTSGINLIDTSANYADGGSEELIGTTVRELEQEGSLSRNQLVVVSKGGYIQGSNYEMARTRIEDGGGFPDVVEYGPGLWHCIAPEFLYDQITRSLDRLKMKSIDIYLLHNPEYYLSWAEKAGVAIDDARAIYYRRIRDAFIHLESEVEKGRIGWYGISSNSFPHSADDPDFTSLEECLKIAEGISLVHHFGAVQFPANLVESGFVTEANQSRGRTLIELAREKNLGVLINRPLNAITGAALVRLADFPAADSSVDDARINEGISALAEMEREFLDTQLVSFEDDPKGSDGLREFVAVGETMRRHWREFGSIEHYNDILSQHFAPRLGYVAQYLREHGTQSHVDWYTRYVAMGQALMRSVAAYYATSAQSRTDRIKQRINAVLDTPADAPLSALATRMLLGVEGVDTVLVGMRRESYVDDLLEASRQGPLGGEDAWRRLDLDEALE